jgi:hypothetical protein
LKRRGFGIINYFIEICWFVQVMADNGESEDDFFTKKQLDLMNMFETNLQKTLSAINNLKITGVEGDDSGG